MGSCLQLVAALVLLCCGTVDAFASIRGRSINLQDFISGPFPPAEQYVNQPKNCTAKLAKRAQHDVTYLISVPLNEDGFCRDGTCCNILNASPDRCDLAVGVRSQGLRLCYFDAATQTCTGKFRSRSQLDCEAVVAESQAYSTSPESFPETLYKTCQEADGIIKSLRPDLNVDIFYVDLFASTVFTTSYDPSRVRLVCRTWLDGIDYVFETPVVG